MSPNNSPSKLEQRDEKLRQTKLLIVAQFIAENRQAQKITRLQHLANLPEERAIKSAMVHRGHATFVNRAQSQNDHLPTLQEDGQRITSGLSIQQFDRQRH